MSPWVRAQVVIGLILICAILAGLVARRRAASCWSFVAYLAAVAVSDLLIAVWPERFFRKDFWILKESVHNLLKLAVALELMVRIFQPFPSAYAVARRGVVLVIAGLGALIWSSLRGGTDYTAVVGRLHPTRERRHGLAPRRTGGVLPLVPFTSRFPPQGHPDRIGALLAGVLRGDARTRRPRLGERLGLQPHSRRWRTSCSSPTGLHVAWRPAAGGDAGTRIGRLLGRRGPG